MTTDHKDHVFIDGQRINIATMSDAVEACIDSLKHGKGFTFLTLNLDHMVKRRKDEAFRNAYARANFISADGQPVVTLARRAGTKIRRTTGADIVFPLCEAAAAAKFSVFLFGTSSTTLRRAAARLKLRYPSLVIAGSESPAMNFDPYGSDAAAAAAAIALSGASLCFIALPTVKQVQFMDRFHMIYPEVGFLGVGAALDFIAGTQVRAPLLVRVIGFEWLWRLASNPRQLFRRYADCAVLYLKLRFQHVRRQEV